jgi:hypothetical protein
MLNFQLSFYEPNPKLQVVYLGSWVILFEENVAVQNCLVQQMAELLFIPDFMDLTFAWVCHEHLNISAPSFYCMSELQVASACHHDEPSPCSYHLNGKSTTLSLHFCPSTFAPSCHW